MIMTIDLMWILRLLVLICGFVDAVKYRIETNKIKRTKSSRDVSRRFTLMAVGCDIVLLAYVILIKDLTLTIVRFMSLYFMCELYWWQYIFYPYKMRKLENFKRPSFFRFFVNSCKPNRIRKRL